MSDNGHTHRRGRRCCEAADGTRRGRGQGALLEPLVLAALAGGGTHGYDVVSRIESLTEGKVTADLGGIYRVLRRLDDAGMVVSAWAEGESGPMRREYRLTSEGQELLAHWLGHLEERKETLDVLIRAVKSASPLL